METEMDMEAMEGEEEAMEGMRAGEPPIEPDMADVIIVGTGLPESLLAAATAMAGRKVLHLDSHGFYGGPWATVQLSVLSSLDPSSQKPSLIPEEIRVPMAAPSPSDAELLPSGFAGSDFSFTGSLQNISEKLSAYSVDLSGPKLALCGEPLVDVLIRAGAHNYLEFKPTDGVYMWRNGALLPVPTSRADVFRASMSLSEKRVVSKFFKRVMDYMAQQRIHDAPGESHGQGHDDGHGHGHDHGHGDGDRGSTESSFSQEDMDAPFVDFLRRQQLSKGIQEFVLHALALIAEDQEGGELQDGKLKLVSTREGLKSMTLYLGSIGRFGPASAFLYPLYGQGELPQAFCRVAAVRGAVYVLRRSIDAILVNSVRLPPNFRLTFLGTYVEK